MNFLQTIVCKMRNYFYTLFLLLFFIVFFSCRKEHSCENCHAKTPPIAKAGADKLVTLPIDSTILDGSSSNDPDGTIINYLWRKLSGPVNYHIQNDTATVTKVSGLSGGIYHFELTVTDNDGLTAKDTVVITVDPGFNSNHPPVADAGTDQTITLPVDSVMLDGSLSTDPDNNIVSHLWTKISGPASYSINSSGSIQTLVKNLTEGVYLFEVKVTDAGGLFSKDTVRITVEHGLTEIIFTERVWVNYCYDPRPGVCWINSDAPSYGFYINDSTNLLPDSASAILGVWVKMDTSSVWEAVPLNCWVFPDPYPQTNFTYCLNPGGLTILSWFFSWVSLEGRKADVKIWY